MDINGRDSAITCVSLGDDDQRETLTASDILDRIAVQFAGMEIDRLVLGEPNWGLHEGYPPVNANQFFGSAVPDSIRELQGESVIATLTEARQRAAELVHEHRPTVETLARIIATERRLSDAVLNEALVQVGLTPVGPRTCRSRSLMETLVRAFEPRVCCGG